MDGKKTNRIRQIVRLRQLMKKWQTLALTRKLSQAAGLAPNVKHRSGFGATDDSDEECPTSPPPDVPKGYLAVYVGGERTRFIIPTCYLSRPVFRTLLQKAEEEFGFYHKGGLTIPCETAVFQRVLWFCESHDPAGRKTVSLDDFFSVEWDSTCASQARKISKRSGSGKSLSSLLRSASLPKSFSRAVV